MCKTHWHANVHTAHPRTPAGLATVQDFYSDPRAKLLFKAFLCTLARRTNRHAAGEPGAVADKRMQPAGLLRL